MARRARSRLIAANAGVTGITAVAPVASALMPAHDAAGSGRRLRGWAPSGVGPNRANAGAGTLRNRARDAARNDWAGRAIPQRWAANMVGTGILARPKTTNADLRETLRNLWDDWTEVCDADGVLDLYGLQNMVARNWIEAGEVFVRLRPRRPEDGLPVPLQIQVIEADMVPATDSRAPNGNEIRQGIEFNAFGQRIAYWLHRAHPGDGMGDTGTLTRVPAEFLLHIYEPSRAGQLRGVSDLAPILARLRGVGDFDDAVLERQKLANLFAGFLERPASGLDAAIDPLTGQPVKTDHDGTPMAALEPGTMQELLPGESVRFSEPPDAGAGYSDFTRQQYQGVAAGTGLPYELLTGDLRGVSDRALRVILNEFRRHCQQRQWHILIPQFCRKVRAAWADAAVIAGILGGAEGREARRVTWVPQGWAYIHPTQDVQAQQIAVESGFTSRSRVITERGDDPEEIDRERAADEDREDALKLGGDAPDIEPPEDDPVATAMLEGQRSLGNAIAQLAAREQPAPQLTVQLPPPGKPTMKVGRRLADGSVEIREIEIGADDAD
jgi:lambda family phage portal protein